MKKSIVIAIVGVLVVAGVGSAVYFQATKKSKVGSAVASTEQEVAVPSADDMEAQVKEVVAAKEAELEAQKAAEEEAARVAAEQAAKEEAEKAAKEKEQVADSNTSTKGNTTAKSNKSGNTGTKSNSSTSSNGNSNNESNSTSAVTDDDNPIPGLTPGQSWNMGEPIHESEIPGGGTAYSYDPIVIPPTE
mgnify:FL=1